MERKKTGLTIIELLIVLGIISLLVGLLVPALSVVKKMARETKQKAQFSTIELALAAFKNDDGDYPPSDPYSWLGDTPDAQNYCGAQKLAEALLGWDLLGFHPDSGWRADGTNRWPYRDPVDPGVVHPPGQYFLYNPNRPIDMDKRKGPYLELATTNAFAIGVTAQHDGLFDFSVVSSSLDSAPDTFVICDAFATKKIMLANGKSVSAGAPILYFKANTSSKRIEPPRPFIYDLEHNLPLIQLGRIKDGRQHELNNLSQFIEKIRDPKIEARLWPYRPDSYILISAGADGLYGTPDDICNFGY